MARLPFKPGGGAVVLDAVDGGADIGEAHRRAVAPGDDLLLPCIGSHQLAVDMNQGRLAGTVQRAGCDIDIGRLHGGRHLVDADVARRELGGIDLQPHGEYLGALDIDLRDARQGGKLPRQQILGIFVQLIERHGIRLHRQEQDWGIRRIDFVQGRR